MAIRAELSDDFEFEKRVSVDLVHHSDGEEAIVDSFYLIIQEHEELQVTPKVIRLIDEEESEKLRATVFLRAEKKGSVGIPSAVLVLDGRDYSFVVKETSGQMFKLLLTVPESSVDRFDKKTQAAVIRVRQGDRTANRSIWLVPPPR